MTYVITQACCSDAACVEVCPADCIHPRPDEPGFADAEILYINPKECIDCEACMTTCPVPAIFPDFDLPTELEHYLEINAGYYAVPA